MCIYTKKGKQKKKKNREGTKRKTIFLLLVFGILKKSFCIQRSYAAMALLFNVFSLTKNITRET